MDSSYNGHDGVTDIVGIDLGHGESAVAHTKRADSAGVAMLHYEGGDSVVISVVAEHPIEGVMIGKEAIANGDPSKPLWRRFKSRNLDEPNVSRPMHLFLQALLKGTVEKQGIGTTGAVRYIVGYPTAWSSEVLEKYAQLLRQVGLNDVQLVAESRAAFMYARHQYDVRPDQLARTVLIIDMGSSTTDFTALSHLKERPFDHGHNELGAGLIDQLIFDHLVSRHEQSDLIRQTFAAEPYYRGKWELFCRKAKEEYFSREERFIERPQMKANGGMDRVVYPSGAIIFDAAVTAEDMADILRQPIPALNGQNWPTALRQLLQEVCDGVTQELNAAPDYVILTGGASKMGFVEKACREVFPSHTTIIRGSEPQHAIAKGLALAGRVDLAVKEFHAEVHALAQSKQLDDIVKKHVKTLVGDVATLLNDRLADQFIMPAFEDWKRGKIRTPRDITGVVESRLRDWLNGDEGKREVSQMMAKWFLGVAPEVDSLTRPICVKHGIPASELRLNEVVIATEGLLGGSADPLAKMYEEIMGPVTIAMAAVVATVVTIVSATVTFGIGLLLFPVFVALGWVVKDATREAVMDVDIPNIARRLFPSILVRNKLAEQKPSMYADIVKALNEPKNTEVLVASLVEPIQQELEHDARRAALLIQ